MPPYPDVCLLDADGASAPKGSLVLVAVVAHSAVLEYHVTVLPPMDVVGPFRHRTLQVNKRWVGGWVDHWHSLPIYLDFL